jgi:hypothetical protein
MIPDFPHSPPDGYSYEFEKYNTRLVRIMLRCHREFDYNNGKPTKTVWGFYSPKKREYYSPINATKVGEKVKLSSTRNYTAMPINLKPLEEFFV